MSWGALVTLTGPRAALEAAAGAMAHRGPAHSWSDGTRGLSAIGGAELVSAQGAHGEVQLALDAPASSVAALREELLAAGMWLEQGRGAAAVLLQALSTSPGATVLNRLMGCLYRLQGAWALGARLAGEDGTETLVAVRDPAGLRPLWLGRGAGGWGVASESVALEAAGLSALRPVQPGELVLLSDTVQSLRPLPVRLAQPCAVELVGGMRLDARRDGGGEPSDGWSVQQALGVALAANQGASVDLVVGAPGSEGLAAGFSGLRPVVAPWGPDLQAAPGAVAGRSVALLSLWADESQRWAERLRQAGARVVHVRAALSTASASCPFGLPTGRVGAGRATAACEPGGVDSFKTLAPLDLAAALEPWAESVCNGCRGGTLANAAVVSAGRSQLPLFRSR